MKSTISVVAEEDFTPPVELLARSLGRDEPISERFMRQLREGIHSGALEILAAYTGERAVGAAMVAYRLNISAGSYFASVEDLYVEPESRRQGVGCELLRLADERCSIRGISYVEVQVEEPDAESFYAACGYQWEAEVEVMSRSRPLRGEQ